MPLFRVPLSDLYHAEVYLNGAQNIPNSAFTVVAYDTVEADPQSSFTTGAAALYTAPVAGRYLVTAAVIYANAVATAIASVFQNGAETRRGVQAAAVANATNGVIVSSILRCAVNDTLDVRAFQGQGGNQALSTGSVLCWAQFTYIGKS